MLNCRLPGQPTAIGHSPCPRGGPRWTAIELNDPVPFEQTYVVVVGEWIFRREDPVGRTGMQRRTLEGLKERRHQHFPVAVEVALYSWNRVRSWKGKSDTLWATSSPMN